MTNDGPSSVYKYLSPRRIGSVLEKLLIRFSQVSVLNDALEFKPALKGMGTRADVEQGVRVRLRTKYPGIFTRIEAIHPPERAAQLIAEIVSAGADAVDTEANYERSVKEVYRQLDENFGILSLSGTSSSALMWSHYADGGRGFLVEFDGQHDWFWDKRNERDSFRHLHQVKYLERTPVYFLNLPDDVALYSKSIQWSYEKEWRIIRNFNDAFVKAGPDDYGKDVLLFAIPPSSIKSVVIGYKATAESVQQLRSTVSTNPALSHVRFQRAILTDDAAVDIVPES
jgi:hypothetical protein